MSMQAGPIPTSVWETKPATAPSTSPPSPWGALASAAPAPCSLQEVMSEQLASELQDKTMKEQDSSLSTPVREEPTGAAACAEVDLTAFIVEDMDPEEQKQMLREQMEQLQQVEEKSEKIEPILTEEQMVEQEASDVLMAQMLQHQYDLEHDDMLKREEAKYNGSSKVTLNFTNYRNVHPAMEEDEESENEDDYLWEERPEKNSTPQFKRGTGISGKGKNIITKHDSTICGRKNATRIMDRFPPEFETGDGQGMDMKLPNHVYNKLKRHSEATDKRSARLHEKKEHATAEMAVDQKTRLIMYKLVNGEILENINGVISAGKESVVFHAKGGGLTTDLVPDECAIKVFKTTLNEFKNRIDYVRGDPRFMKDEFKKQNPRRIIKMWAQKEEQNLRRLESAGVPCPHVVTLKKHVLVMSFLGKNQQAAPKLKDAHLSTVDMQMAYEQCVAMMKKMYNEAGLVHGDFSEYNLLWYNDMVYVIDVSQAVIIHHPHAAEFLLRDCNNICSFFKKNGIPNVPTKYQLFNDITGLDLQGEEGLFLKRLQGYEKNEEKLRMDKGKEYPFDYFFEMAQKERESELSERLNLSSDDSDSEDEEELEPVPISKSPGGNKSSKVVEKKGGGKNGGSGKKGKNERGGGVTTGKTTKLKQEHEPSETSNN